MVSVGIAVDKYNSSDAPNFLLPFGNVWYDRVSLEYYGDVVRIDMATSISAPLANLGTPNVGAKFYTNDNNYTHPTIIATTFGTTSALYAIRNTAFDVDVNRNLVSVDPNYSIGLTITTDHLSGLNAINSDALKSSPYQWIDLLEGQLLCGDGGFIPNNTFSTANASNITRIYVDEYLSSH